MNHQIAEKKFEEAIEAGLCGQPASVSAGSTFRESAAPYDASLRYISRPPAAYDRKLCLLPEDVIDFVQATQPKEWEKLKQHYGDVTREKFLQRVATEVNSRGTLHVLRKGVKDSGSHFRLAYFPPASGLNEDLQRLYHANIFSLVRQLRFSEKSEDSLDLGLFVNGLPIFTAELKNPLNGQDIKDAIKQYENDRDPKEPLFTFGRCLAHFAVDPDFVYVTTKLEGPTTRFLPFNQGKFGGAGNPPAATGYSTAYLWQEIWAPESVLNLIQYFVHAFDEEDASGKKTGRKLMIFPRYHQVDAVRRLVGDAKINGPGHRYLVQHSAGSGKSNSIAWLAHQLSVLHDAHDQRVFDSIIVITDRRILDRQLQQTIRQFEQTVGVVENISHGSKHLKDALEQGKTIIVSTLQKFPHIQETIGQLPGKRFAIIADEAHSSQSGEASGRSLKAVFAPKDLDAAEKEGAEEDKANDPDDFFEKQMGQRQFARLKNVSVFAFTATPKQKTLELFGTKRPDGKFEPFSLYSMRQAIEEKFILDVLENYTTYHDYWSLLKIVEDDPHYDREKASYLLRSFVNLNELVIEKKVAIIVDHFTGQVAHRIGGKAKAMIVTRSRLHAVRFKRVLDDYLKSKGSPYKALVAFSGSVEDPGNALEYTEHQMNGIPETQTAATFNQPAYRFLVVAEKFQTGFDQPLLHTMYVDKKLSGLNAVQTLSRLNRTHPEKQGTMVLDFVNEAEDIKAAFEPYYERTLLTEGTDPNKLYDVQHRLTEHGVYTEADIETVANILIGKRPQDEIYAALAPVVARFQALDENEQAGFRGTLNDYIRLYAFLSQVLTFTDAELEKLYVFGRLLARRLPPIEGELPKEITENIDIESYRIQQISSGKIALERGENELDPMSATGAHQARTPEQDALSMIIRQLNDRFGTDFTEADHVFIKTLEQRLGADANLRTAVNTNPPDNARLTFTHKATDEMQDLVETDFKFYKRVNDDPAFARYFLDWLFDRYRKKEKR